MPAPVTLAFSGDQHTHLHRFLFPGDGLEAVALLLCSRRDGDRCHRLVVREIHDIPYEHCTVRTATRVTWSPDYIDTMLKAIVGIEIELVSLQGKWKVSQNRPAKDRESVAEALRDGTDTHGPAMAALVRPPDLSER